MSQKTPFDQDLLIQAGVAAELANTLPAVATNAYKDGTKVSIENAIITLLAPFQPAEAEKAQPTSDRRQDGEAGTASTPEPEGKICPGCGKVHTAEEFAHVAALRDLLESIFGEGSVQVIRKPETKH